MHPFQFPNREGEDYTPVRLRINDNVYYETLIWYSVHEPCPTTPQIDAGSIALPQAVATQGNRI
jgi:hypothetical protein